MENIEAYKRKLSAIGEAIRAKTGKTDLLDLDEMATEIEGIEVGGNTETEDGLVARTLTEYHNDRITEIGAYGFAGSSKLESVALPNVTALRAYAFYECTSLQEVTFPSVTSSPRSGSRVFYGCTGLIKADFPKLKEFSSAHTYWFNGCTALKDVNLPLLTNISLRTFYGCTSLEKLLLPSVSTINGREAFVGCTTLEALILKHNAVVTIVDISPFTNTPIANGTGYIYVPKTLIEDYKAATNWITFAEQFRAIEDYPEICGGAEND